MIFWCIIDCETKSKVLTPLNIEWGYDNVYEATRLSLSVWRHFIQIRVSESPILLGGLHCHWSWRYFHLKYLNCIQASCVKTCVFFLKITNLFKDINSCRMLPLCVRFGDICSLFILVVQTRVWTVKHQLKQFSIWELQNS